jgi:hypothetical protein
MLREKFGTLGTGFSKKRKWNVFTIDRQTGVWNDGHLEDGKSFSTIDEVGLNTWE